MVWGGFSYSGVGKLVRIEWKIDRFQYLKILKENMEVSFYKLGIFDLIFQLIMIPSTPRLN
ncbi:hypothetical protein EHP00_1575 [Ecytonucleospora hepatopenaei]|uniref:Uncharacterized protein n=1 Tax=Ecytonucleospora hepatopenaei TaxID=646526 RepID=A0A1W0E8Q5_9MICR|nr:hypothetical protein EHP00_1575 [Ecytonucleospora hepatopenaei]